MRKTKKQGNLPIVNKNDLDYYLFEREIPIDNYNATLRYLIELVLFCPRGKIDRSPSFGSDIYSILFIPETSPELIKGFLAAILNNLNSWLGDFIKVKNAEIRYEENKLYLTLRYVNLREKIEKTLLFSQTEN